MMLLLTGWSAKAQQRQTGVYAEAIGQANLRTAADIESRLIGEIHSGTEYPILGRNARFPWLLLGERDSTVPMGWVFETLVAVAGDLNQVPFTELILDAAAPTEPAITVTARAPIATVATAAPTAEPSLGAFGVSGVVSGEVNVRYGPGLEYPRAGVGYAGDRFEVTGYHTQFPWVRIRYEGAASGQAWIARDLLEISGNLFATAAISQLRFSLPPLTPTPAAVRAIGINGEDALPLGGELQTLATELWNLLLENDFDPQTSRFGALFFMDLASGEAFSFGDEYAFSGTSLNKIAILVKLYAELHSPPSIETTTDILNTMICSENAATNRLLSIIGAGNTYYGAEAVTELFQQLGLTRSFLIAPFTTIGTPEPPPFPLMFPATAADQVKAAPDLSNQLTVVEIGALLANLYQCAYGGGGALLQHYGEELDARECRQMLHVMSNNTVDALLKSGAPANIRVAHKHGWIADTHGNAALFFTPGGDYVIAMMLFQPQWLDFQESLPLFAEVSRRVYNHYNPDQPQQSGREWFIPDVNSCNYFGDPLIADLLQTTWDG
ncbi:MAG: serine hydrolase [Chloroflexi bacterium]|nr:serine hydrolase [Chloroflexota bacterium]